MKTFHTKKNRKGFITDMQMAVLAVAAIVIFSLFLHKAYVTMSDRMAVNSCKSSIQAHSIVATSSAGEIYTDIKCPTNEITIKKLKTAKQAIAEDMHRCWYIWGQGDGRYFKGDGIFCHVCSIYQFGDKGQTVNGFMQYLAETPLQTKYPGDTKGISYQDYFTGYTTSHSAQLAKNTPMQNANSLDVINTSQKYATIFVYASGKDAIDKMLEGGGRSTLFAGGGVTLLLGTAAAASGVTAIGVLAAAGTISAANIWNPIGWVLGGLTLVAAGVYAIYKATDIGQPEWISFIAFRTYNDDALDSLNCQKFAVNQMSNAGK